MGAICLIGAGFEKNPAHAHSPKAKKTPLRLVIPNPLMIIERCFGIFFLWYWAPKYTAPMSSPRGEKTETSVTMVMANVYEPNSSTPSTAESSSVVPSRKARSIRLAAKTMDPPWAISFVALRRVLL